jgi:hypothetical protein
LVEAVGIDVSYAAGGARLFALQDQINAYGEALEGTQYRLAGPAACDFARLDIALNAGWIALVAGWYGLIYIDWPYADHFDSAMYAMDEWLSSGDRALAFMAVCASS